MAREKTTVDIDLDEAVSSRRKQTGMHGTQSRNTGRGAISKLNNISQVKEGVNELVVSTDECSLWSYNDRIYEGINMENCKSLIDDIQKNTQLQAVVARLDPTGKKKYEIIIGTRRFWACSHIPAKKIKIKLIDADDKRAYKIMRSENAERDDTTAYEKAINAKHVIAEIYGGSQKDYCIENEINEKTLSTWMAIADMEPEVKAVIPDMFEVTVKQAMKLRAVINKLEKSKKAVIARAQELKGTDFTTAAILKELIAVGEATSKPKVRGPVEKTYSVAGNKKGVVIKEAANGAITIKVSKDVSANKESIMRVLAQHFQ